jgi:hypothetical protein
VVALDPGDAAQRVRSGASDAEGSFAITGLEERPYRLWVQPPLGWREFPLLEVAEVRPGDAPLVLRVPDPALRGRITAEVFGPDGAPLAGAELQVWHVELGQWRGFVSRAADGAITVEGVPDGTVELELRHPEHPWAHLGEERIAGGATLDLGRIELAAAGSLRARLSGLAEADYPALTAVLADASSRESAIPRISPGCLAAGALAPGEHVLLVGGDGVRQVRRTFQVQAGVETTLDIELERCGLRVVAFELPDGERPRGRAGSGARCSGRRGRSCGSAPPTAPSSPPRRGSRRLRGATGSTSGGVAVWRAARSS